MTKAKNIINPLIAFYSKYCPYEVLRLWINDLVMSRLTNQNQAFQRAMHNNNTK